MLFLANNTNGDHFIRICGKLFVPSGVFSSFVCNLDWCVKQRIRMCEVGVGYGYELVFKWLESVLKRNGDQPTNNFHYINQSTVDSYYCEYVL